MLDAKIPVPPVVYPEIKQDSKVTPPLLLCIIVLYIVSVVERS